MPHNFIPAWPWERGKTYDRYPITETIISPEDSPVDATYQVRANVRLGFHLGFQNAGTDLAADLEAAVELTGAGSFALPFAEWDAVAQDYVLSPAYLGGDITGYALPFSGQASADVADVRLLVNGDEGLPVAMTYAPADEWPHLDKVTVTEADILAAGGLGVSLGGGVGPLDPPATLILRYYVPVRRVRMCAYVAQDYQLQASANTLDRWQCNLTIEETEAAARAAGWTG